MIEKLKNLGTELVSRGMSSKIVQNHTPKNDYIIDFSGDILSNFYKKIVKITDTEFFQQNINTDFTKSGKDYAQNAFISKNQLNKQSSTLKSQIDSMISDLNIYHLYDLDYQKLYWIESNNDIDIEFEDYEMNKMQYIKTTDRLSNIILQKYINDEAVIPDYDYNEALGDFCSRQPITDHIIDFYTTIDKYFMEDSYYYYRGEPFKSNYFNINRFLTAPTKCVISNPFSKPIQVCLYIDFPKNDLKNNLIQQLSDETYDISNDETIYSDYNNRLIKINTKYSANLSAYRDVIINKTITKSELVGCGLYGIDFLSTENVISDHLSTTTHQYDILTLTQNNPLRLVMPHIVQPHYYYNFNLFDILVEKLNDFYFGRPYDFVVNHQEIKNPNVVPKNQTINFYENKITSEQPTIKVFFRFFE